MTFRFDFGAVKVILEPDCSLMIHTTSCRNVITASAVLVLFWLVLLSRERQNFIWFSENIQLYLQIFNTKNYILFKSQPRFIFEIFLEFHKFQPRCSNKMYSPLILKRV